MPLDPVPAHEITDISLSQPAPARTRQWRVFLMTGLVLAAIVAAFALYHRFEKAQIASFMARPLPPTPISAVVAEVHPVPKSLPGIGTLQAVRQVMVAPEVGGMVTQILFTPGTTVAAGDPLVQLNDAPERADLANFQALLRVATANLERDKALSARDFQSHQMVDQQQSLHDQAEAGIAKAQAQIAQKLIRAPFAGQLGVRQVNLGAYVNPGGTVVTLTDLSSLWVNFTLPEQTAAQVKVGQPAELRVDAYPGRVFNAQVTAIEPQISQQTRTLLVQATLDNQDHALLPGMFANVAVVLPEAPSLVVLPETAVDFSLYGDSVFVVYEDGKDDKGQPVLKVKRSFVKVADKFDGKVAILSGLTGGEQVAASGQLKLNNGTVVAIQPGDPLVKAPSAARY
jgi:multidrug efflux system membrane fusion protein